MKHYELAIVFHPDLEIDLDASAKKIEGLITDAKGVIDKKDNWGKRKLAYRINGQSWGIYVFYQLQLEPAAVQGLEQNLKIADEVMRWLIVSLENQKQVNKKRKTAVTKAEAEAVSPAEAAAATTQGE